MVACAAVFTAPVALLAYQPGNVVVFAQVNAAVGNVSKLCAYATLDKLYVVPLVVPVATMLIIPVLPLELELLLELLEDDEDELLLLLEEELLDDEEEEEELDEELLLELDDELEDELELLLLDEDDELDELELLDDELLLELELDEELG